MPPIKKAEICFILAFPDDAEEAAAPTEKIRGLKDAPYFQPVDIDVRTLGQVEVQAGLSLRPAQILGLKAGRLAKGWPADLLIFNPDRSWKIEPDNFASKSKNSPFEGLPVQGRVRRTVVDGRALFEAA
jgi:dihydroorotase